jgi:hypothetical protein
LNKSIVEEPWIVGDPSGGRNYIVVYSPQNLLDDLKAWFQTDAKMQSRSVLCIKQGEGCCHLSLAWTDEVISKRKAWDDGCVDYRTLWTYLLTHFDLGHCQKLEGFFPDSYWMVNRTNAERPLEKTILNPKEVES